MREKDINALIEYRLEEAREALADAELLLKAERYRSAANRLYYAAFYAAVAVLLTKDNRTITCLLWRWIPTKS